MTGSMLPTPWPEMVHSSVIAARVDTVEVTSTAAAMEAAKAANDAQLGGSRIPRKGTAIATSGAARSSVGAVRMAMVRLSQDQ